MDLAKMIGELQEERRRLDEAIEALERLSAGQSRRRGRPARHSDELLDQLPSAIDFQADSTPHKTRKTVDRSQ